MSEATGNRPVAPSSTAGRARLIGPGVVVAATGVGAGDLVASLVAGTQFGLVFLWAIIVGSVIKFFLTEGVGRWHLATGQTILQGWHSLGRLATGYFGVYAVIWGFVFGAAAISACGLALNAMFPFIPLWLWAILNSLAGFAIVWTGRYDVFERIMKWLVAVMFVTVVGSALLVLPGIGEFSLGLVPRIPDGSLIYALGLLGGVGGTITLASYGYWLREKEWRGGDWVPVMRIDSAAAYIITGVFIIATLILGSQLLFGTGDSIDGDQGLVILANALGDEVGGIGRWLFLIGFWAASFTSVLGVWNGVPYLFADFIRTVFRPPGAALSDDDRISEKSPAYRAYLIWLTFPPMLLLLLGQPTGLVIAYAAIGSLFMPFLAITLLLLLNSQRVEQAHRNHLAANVALGVTVLLFIFLGLRELIGTF